MKRFFSSDFFYDFMRSPVALVSFLIVDAMIASLESETDLAKRDATIASIWSKVQDAQMYLPIHNQVLNWGMKSNIEFAVQPEDQPHFQFLKMN
jgi:peptide/nickel transport system substrate-binding protein